MVSFSVPASTYIGKTPADTNVKVFITAKVKETGQVWHEDAAIVVKKPEIEFGVGGRVGGFDGFGCFSGLLGGRWVYERYSDLLISFALL